MKDAIKTDTVKAGVKGDRKEPAPKTSAGEPMSDDELAQVMGAARHAPAPDQILQPVADMDDFDRSNPWTPNPTPTLRS